MYILTGSLVLEIFSVSKITSKKGFFIYILLTFTIKLITNSTFWRLISHFFTDPYIVVKLKFNEFNCPWQRHYIMKRSVLLPQLTEIPLKNLETRFWSNFRLGETSKCHINIFVFSWHYLLMVIKEILDMTIKNNSGKLRLQKRNVF